MGPAKGRNATLLHAGNACSWAAWIPFVLNKSCISLLLFKYINFFCKSVLGAGDKQAIKVEITTAQV